MANPPPSATTTLEFTEGEKVLCFHGPLLYEAKIIRRKNFIKDSSTGQKGLNYFVHYRGWKATWDEWVHQDRMLKWEEKNLAVQKKLMAEHRAVAVKSREEDDIPRRERERKIPGGQPKDMSLRDAGMAKEPKAPKREGRSRKTEDEGYGAEIYNWNVSSGKRRAEVKLFVPEILKAVMVDDWEAITKNGQLVPLPRQPNVEDILTDFRNYIWDFPMANAPTKRSENLPLFLIGIKTYFEEALGATLLYRFERPQYADMLRKYAYGPDVPAERVQSNCRIYGAEHLLRLLVSLPTMVTSASMDASSANVIREYSNYLLEFLAKGKDRFFLTVYDDTSSNYLSLARA